jgi:hypothetical protein
LFISCVLTISFLLFFNFIFKYNNLLANFILIISFFCNFFIFFRNENSKNRCISSMDKSVFTKLSQIGLELSDSLHRKESIFGQFSFINVNIPYIYSQQFYLNSSPGMVFSGYVQHEGLKQFQKYRQNQDLFYQHFHYYKFDNVDSAILHFIKSYKVNHVYKFSDQGVPFVLKPKLLSGFPVGCKGDSIYFLR